MPHCVFTIVVYRFLHRARVHHWWRFGYTCSSVRFETWPKISKLTLNHAQVLRSAPKFAPGHDQLFFFFLCTTPRLLVGVKYLYEVLNE